LQTWVLYHKAHHPRSMACESGNATSIDKTLKDAHDVHSSSTASTEASLSDNSSHGSQTPPTEREKLHQLKLSLEASQHCFSTPPKSEHKRTRRSNRRKKDDVECSITKPLETNGYAAADEHSVSRRAVVTVSDLCFDLVPQSLDRSSFVSTPVGAATAEDALVAPVSPCRTRSGPSGIVSTNPCHDVATTMAPASERIPQTRSRFGPLSQAAPSTLDLRLCSNSSDNKQPSPLHSSYLGSPCKGRTSGSMGIVSATPCATPTSSVHTAACNTPKGVVSATPCNTPTSSIQATVSTSGRLADASARTPHAAPAHGTQALCGARLSSGFATTPQTAPTADVFSLGIEPGSFSPSQPQAVFLRAASQPEKTAAGPALGTAVVPDVMRSWLQCSGLPSVSETLEAELRAAVPETYED